MRLRPDTTDWQLNGGWMRSAAALACLSTNESGTEKGTGISDGSTADSRRALNCSVGSVGTEAARAIVTWGEEWAAEAAPEAEAVEAVARADADRPATGSGVDMPDGDERVDAAAAYDEPSGRSDRGVCVPAVGP